MIQIADLVFTNANILTMDDSLPTARALAVRDGKIIAVGDDTAMQQYVGNATKVINLEGRTLLPGFNDSHMHLLAYGDGLSRVDLAGVTSIAESIERVRAKAAVTPPGDWICGRGWDQNLFQEGRFFHRSDLDLAAPDHPVSLRRVCGHLTACNTRALALAGITADTPNPEGGEIDREATGQPTGILREKAADPLTAFMYPVSYETGQMALQRAMAKAVAMGLTSVTTDDVRYAGGVEKCLSLYRETWETGHPAIRANLLIANHALDELLSRGLKTGDGDERVRIGPMKVFQDGGLGGLTAALREPYTSDPDCRGIIIWSQDKLDSMVAKAHNAGMQVAIHAVGDAAVASCLDAYERALADHPRPNHRHRIIHYCIVDEALMAKTRELEVGADIQPRFVSLNGKWAERFLGPERAKYTYPWKTILARGIPCGGGSDCPVERPEPLLGIHNAVNRQVDTVPGLVFEPQESLTPLEALKLFTVGSAYSTFEEDIKGTLTPGKLADLVVLSDDPCAVPPETIRDLKVEMTVVDGKIVHEI